MKQNGSFSSNTTFYVMGGTMPLGAASYVTRTADTELLAALKRGELCYVLNARQMGKSSLINRVAQSLRAEGVAVAQLDLTAIGQNLNASQWYYGLLCELGQQVGLEDEVDDWWLEHESLGAMQRFFAAIRTVVLPALAPRPLVVAVDEIDAVRSISDFNTDEFFAGIRASFLERAQNDAAHRLTFCLLGTATPADLVKDVRVTPFNIGKRIELRDFTPTEAAPFAAHLPGGTATLTRILHWTGGHPYLTQSLCRAASEAPGKSVDALVSDLFLSHGARESEANLTLVRDRLLRADCDQFALLSLYRQVWQNKRVADDDTNPICDVLKLSGVVRVESGLLRLRNTIYKTVFDAAWIEKHLPGAEVRRQAQAFRRGLVLASAAASVMVASMGTLAVIAYRNEKMAQRASVRANALTHKAEQAAYVANMNLIGTEWDAGNVSHIRQLLDETKRFVGRGFEWGYWNRLCHQEIKTLPLTGDPVVFSPNGTLLFTNDNADLAGASGSRPTATTGVLWDTRTWKAARHLDGRLSTSCAAFSPDGTRIVTGGDGSMAHLWNAATGKQIATLRGHQKRVDAVAFSPDGKRIVTGSDDGTVRVWDATTGKVGVTVPLKVGGGYTVRLTPDGKYFLVGSDKQPITLYETGTGKMVRTMEDSTNSSCITCSPDGAFIAAGSYDLTLRIWNTETGKVVQDLTENKDLVHSLVYFPDGKHLLTGTTSDNTKVIWDTRTGKRLRTIKGDSGEVVQVAVSPNGKYMATADNERSVTLSRPQAQNFLSLDGFDKFYVCVAVSPDGKMIATRGYLGKTVVTRLYDAASGKRQTEWHVPQTSRPHPASVVFLPDGKTVALANDNTVVLRDLATGKPVRTFQGSGIIGSVAVTPDGKCIAARDRGGMVQVWNIDGTVHLKKPMTGGWFRSTNALAFCRGGSTLLSANINEYFDTVALLDAQSGKQVQVLKGHLRWVNAVATFDSGKRIVTTSDDKTAKIWDAGTGKCLLTLNGHRSYVIAVAISPDAKRIMTGSDDNTARVWDTETGKELLTLKGHTGAVTSVSFSPNGKRIITGSADGTVRVWFAGIGDANAVFARQPATL